MDQPLTSQVSAEQNHIVELMLSTVPSDVPQDVENELDAILRRNILAFASHSYDVGEVTFYTHHVTLKNKDAFPVQENLRRHSEPVNKVIDAEINKMAQAGIIH